MDQHRLEEGIAFFNVGRFYDAHEALEDVWREMTGPDKLFMQGLVQVAVGLHHHSTGNPQGARSLLARAAVNLDGAPDEFFGIALIAFRRSLQQWQQALAQGSATPPLPRLQTKPRC